MGDPGQRKQHPSVLIVDDYDDGREMYAEFLEFSGFRVTQAKTGKEGMAKAQESLPDIILMDLSLPDIDGREASRQLRQDVRTRHIPVVALTGHSLPTLGEASGATPYDALVIKPCLPDALLNEIKQVLEASARGQLNRK
ncbi:MAG TPA: response regulator [Myxococcaceae bacterium]|nr:response regulator [Myxococcaceae bacterium]